MKHLIKSILIFSFFFTFFRCENIFDSDDQNRIVINRNLVADMLGNNDNSTTNDEISKLDSFFNVSKNGWAIGTWPNDSSNSIKAEVIKEHFHIESPLCKDETELRSAFEGISARSLYVGIYVIKSEKDIVIQKLYRSSGNISKSNWQVIQIK